MGLQRLADCEKQQSISFVSFRVLINLEIHESKDSIDKCFFMFIFDIQTAVLHHNKHKTLKNQLADNSDSVMFQPP